MIYFVWNRAENSIKIGYTRSPATLQKRLKTFNCANPAVLEVLHTEPGDRVKEARLHREFANLHRGGEWFWYSGTAHSSMDKTTQTSYKPLPVTWLMFGGLELMFGGLELMFGGLELMFGKLTQ